MRVTAIVQGIDGLINDTHLRLIDASMDKRIIVLTRSPIANVVGHSNGCVETVT